MTNYSNKKNWKTKNFHRNNQDTSWENVSDWYDKTTGERGHYYQENLILPKSLELLNIQQTDAILDLGCGQGIFSRHIPQECTYTGIDLSANLIQFAKQRNRNRNFDFAVADVSKPLPIGKKDYNKSLIILALQNIESIEGVFQNLHNHLISGGQFLMVLNHPSFRIPRQTSWEIDQNNKMQYRRVNRYYTPLKIPVNMTPGQKAGKVTWSFHNPLEVYCESLRKNGFLIETIQEWISPKESVGKAARMENRAREEFPMFMAILAVKK